MGFYRKACVMGINLAFTLLVALTVPCAFAAKINASCFTNLDADGKIEGVNITKRIPMASVSKLVTSHWLLKSKGLDYQFPTQIYVEEVSKGLYDLHFQGSRDPYFGAERMHYVISELNKRGITNIRNLTFDENFKFLWFVDDPESLGVKNIAVGFYVNSQPSPQTVMLQLKREPSLLSGYSETREKAKKYNVDLVKSPVFKIKNFEYVASSDFRESSNQKVFIIYSASSANLLKEMNRNSNNHSANQIFEHLGSSEKYSDFIKEDLGLDKSDIVMLNGSGDRNDTPEGAKYNEATCEAVLKIIIDSHKYLIAHKKNLGAIATIVGTNPGNATALYNNDVTKDAVIAKTGTVNPSITLGGVASTKNGLIFFMYMVSPEGSRAQARGIIRTEITKLINKNGGAKPVNGQSFSFFTIDKDSFEEAQAVGKMP